MRRRSPVQKLPAGDTPAALLVGRCIEVWSDPTGRRSTVSKVHTADYYSARRRHGLARTGWLKRAGITETSDQCRLAPMGSTWSISWLLADGREAQAVERLARAGCSLDDLEALRVQADDLYREAVPA